MSLRSRYQRYRRYGLEPLPDDASQEARDERAEELRTLRRRRRLRAAFGTGLSTLVLVLLSAVLLWWLLTTISGRKVLMQQIVARLPANTTLTWKSAEGPANGPLLLRDVRFTWFTCADKNRPVNAPVLNCKDRRTSVFTARELLIDPSISPLLSRKLQLDRLHASGAQLALAKSDEPFELPTWPEVLPRIEPPLGIEAHDVRVDDLHIINAGEPVIRMRTLRGAALAERGLLDLRNIAIDSDRGRFALHGIYAPRDHYAMNLTATGVFPARIGQTAGRIGLVAKGDLTKMDVFVGGRAPAPLRATLTLRAKDRSEAAQDQARWTLKAFSEALDPAIFTGQRSDTLLSFSLDADGVGGKANLQGRAQLGEQLIVLQPSKVSLEDKTLAAQPLVVDALGGRVTLNGRGDFSEGAKTPLKFAANARGLRWGGTTKEPLIRGDGDFGMAGTPDAWAVVGNATLLRGAQKALVKLDGRGNREGMAVRSLEARMPTGALLTTGKVGWAPDTHWNLDANLSGFDPGYFVPEWPGAVRGHIATQGRIGNNGQLVADVQVPQLGGALRGRALDGRGTLRIIGEEYSGQVNLVMGSSRVDAQGRIGQRLDIDAKFSPLQLNDLLPSANGVLNGTLLVRGPRNQPDIDANLTGSALRYGDYRADALTARGHLPWQGNGGQLHVEARGVQAGMTFDHVVADAVGAMENLRLTGQASGDMGRVELAGTALRNGENWSGMLQSLDFAPAKGAAWRLQAPLRYAQAGDAWRLNEGCFASSGGGHLCVVGQWPGRGMDVRGNGLPLALAAPYLPPREDGKRWELNGLADIDAKVRPVGNAWSGTAQIRSTRGGLRIGGQGDYDLIGYDALMLDATFDPQHIRGTVTGGLRGGGRSAASGRVVARIDTGWDEYAPLNGSVDVDTRELTWLELLSPDFVDPTGELTGRILLGGTRGAPTIGGNAHLTNLRVEMPALGVVLTQGDVRMTAQADGTARLQGNVRSGEGVLNLDGTLGWREGEAPLVLNVRGNNVLASDTRDLRAVINPDITVRYSAGQPINVTGTVGIPSARMDLERLDDGVSRSSDVVVLDPAKPTDKAATPLALDITLVPGDDVTMRGFGLDGKLGGRLRVRSTAGQEMRATGTLTVDGRYLAYGQRLQIEDGQLTWSNDPIALPSLNIRAQREVGDVTAGIKITGRANAPQAEVWADPAMDESEALAYLTLGRSLTTASTEEGRQISAASAALSAGGSLLASQLGAKIGLDDAGVMQSRALGGSVFGVGKYLSPKLYVGYGVSLLGTGQVLTLKYLLRKGFNITIESSTVENRASVNWRTER